MFSYKEILTFAYESEYDNAYDLSEKRLFSKPKIYTAKDNLDKRWYVYFSYRDPETGKLKRLTPFYGEANKYKTKEERLEVLTTYRRVLLKLLKQGFNPYKDNTELFQKLNKKKKTHSTQTHTTQIVPHLNYDNIEDKMSIDEAFKLGLKLKEKTVSERTLQDYTNKVRSFLEWLENEHSEIKRVDKLNKSLFQNYLNSVLARSSTRNRNNYRTDLSSVVQVLEDNDVIKKNYLKKNKKTKYQTRTT